MSINILYQISARLRHSGPRQCNVTKESYRKVKISIFVCRVPRSSSSLIIPRWMKAWMGFREQTIDELKSDNDQREIT